MVIASLSIHRMQAIKQSIHLMQAIKPSISWESYLLVLCSHFAMFLGRSVSLPSFGSSLVHNLKRLNMATTPKAVLSLEAPIDAQGRLSLWTAAEVKRNGLAAARLADSGCCRKASCSSSSSDAVLCRPWSLHMHPFIHSFIRTVLCFAGR